MTQRLAGLEARLRLALRSVHPAPRDSRERVRSRLAAALIPLDLRSSQSAPRGPGDTPVASNLSANGAASLVSRAFGAGKLVALTLLGATGGAALIASVAARKPAQIVYVDRPGVETPVAPTAAGGPSTSMQSTPILPSTPMTPPALGESGATQPGAPSTTTSGEPAASADARRHLGGAGVHAASTLAAERVLLDEARKALVQGDPQHALAMLGRHRSRFARGALAEEREAMWVEALVAQYRFPEARAAAQAFRARNPHSLFLPAVEAAAQSIP